MAAMIIVIITDQKTQKSESVWCSYFDSCCGCCFLIWQHHLAEHKAMTFMVSKLPNPISSKFLVKAVPFASYDTIKSCSSKVKVKIIQIFYQQAYAECFVGLKPTKMTVKGERFYEWSYFLSHFFFWCKGVANYTCFEGWLFLVFRMKCCFWMFQHRGLAVIVWD